TEETFLAPLHPPEFYRPQAKNHLRWLDRRWLYGIPRSLQTEGLRPLGRLALVDNAADLLPRLREALAAITSPEAAATTAAHTRLPLREEGPRVFLVASVVGGTGSGMVLGMAYAVRQVLAEMHLPTNGLCGLLLHATSPKPSEQEMARANAYATLNELDHFSQPGAVYPGDPDFGLTSFGPEVPPFEECYLVHLGERLTREDASAATCSVADYLELNACPAAGAFLDRYRQNTHAGEDGIGGSVALRSFGLFRITAPGPRLAGLTSDLLCGRVIDRWLGSCDEAESQRLEGEVQRKVATLGLEEKPLQTRFQTAAAAALDEGPDACFTRLVTVPGTDPAPPTPEIATELLRTIHAVLGAGVDPNNPTGGPLTALEATLQAHAKDLAAKQGRALLEWLLDLVEKPGARLRAADVAASALVKHLAIA